MNDQFDQLINSYLENKVGIAENFLSKSLSDGLQQHILALQEDNKMTASGIGNSNLRDANQQMRADSIYWLDKSHSNVYEQQFLEHAEDFISHLNSTCYAGINDYEFHFAIYGEGHFYKRHRDQFRSDNNRRFSLIHYLNENWQEEDGGHLLVYQAEEVQQVKPEARKAVFFKSDEMEHEVAPANRTRMSISGWLKQVS